MMMIRIRQWKRMSMIIDIWMGHAEGVADYPVFVCNCLLWTEKKIVTITSYTFEWLRTKITVHVTNGTETNHIWIEMVENRNKIKTWFHYAVLTVILILSFSSLPFHAFTLCRLISMAAKQSNASTIQTMTIACQISTVTKVVWQITHQKVGNIYSNTLMACYRLTHVNEPIPLANSSCSIIVFAEKTQSYFVSNSPFNDSTLKEWV